MECENTYDFKERLVEEVDTVSEREREMERERERESAEECHALLGSFGKFLKYQKKEVADTATPPFSANYTFEEALLLLLKGGGKYFEENYERFYGEDGVRLDFSSSSSPPSSPSPSFSPTPASSWANPLTSQLPFAPNMKIYCLYGVEKMTERGYDYTDPSVTPFELYYKWKDSLFRRETDEEGVLEELEEELESIEEALEGARERAREGEGVREKEGREKGKEAIDSISESQDQMTSSFLKGLIAGNANGSSVFLSMDVTTTNAVTPPDLDCGSKNGVRNCDGDGTVPLISLGYMCVKVRPTE